MIRLLLSPVLLLTIVILSTASFAGQKIKSPALKEPTQFLNGLINRASVTNVQESFLNEGASVVRSCPSLSCKKIKTVYRGQKEFYGVKMEEKKDWLRLMRRDGTPFNGYAHKSVFNEPFYNTEQKSTVYLGGNKEDKVEAIFTVTPQDYKVSLRNKNETIFEYTAKHKPALYNDSYPTLYGMKVKGKIRAWIFGWNNHKWNFNSMFSAARIIVPYYKNNRVQVFSRSFNYVTNKKEFSIDVENYWNRGLIVIGTDAGTTTFATGHCGACTQYYKFPIYSVVDINKPDIPVSGNFNISNETISAHPYYFLAWGILFNRKDIWKKALLRVRGLLFKNGNDCENKISLNQSDIEKLFQSNLKENIELEKLWLLYAKLLSPPVDLSSPYLMHDVSKRLLEDTVSCYGLSKEDADYFVNYATLLPNKRVFDLLENWELGIATRY